jgi:hypothetical protein
VHAMPSPHATAWTGAVRQTISSRYFALGTYCPKCHHDEQGCICHARYCCFCVYRARHWPCYCWRQTTAADAEAEAARSRWQSARATRHQAGSGRGAGATGPSRAEAAFAHGDKSAPTNALCGAEGTLSWLLGELCLLITGCGCLYSIQSLKTLSVWHMLMCRPLMRR